MLRALYSNILRIPVVAPYFPVVSLKRRCNIKPIKFGSSPRPSVRRNFESASRSAGITRMSGPETTQHVHRTPPLLAINPTSGKSSSLSLMSSSSFSKGAFQSSSPTGGQVEVLDDPEAQFKAIWLGEIVSTGVVRHHRALPPHAGGAVIWQREGEADRNDQHPVDATGILDSSNASDQVTGDGLNEEMASVSSRSGGWLRVPLRDCARNSDDNGAQVRSLLDAGASTEDTDRAGRTPLHWAASRGNVRVVCALLDAGANLSAQDSSGKTPLHCAAVSGHSNIVETLLEFYYILLQQPISLLGLSTSPPSLRNDGTAGVSSIVDARNSYGSTPLHRASFKGRESVVVALLKWGADVHGRGRSGRTALHLACRNAHAGCIEILLASGADEAATAKDRATPWSELAEAAEERPEGHPGVARALRALRLAASKRAWGRRSWLVMLHDACRRHSRDLKRNTKFLKVPRKEVSTAPVNEDSKALQAPCKDPEPRADEQLFETVERLLQCGEEGTFRLVVGFI